MAAPLRVASICHKKKLLWRGGGGGMQIHTSPFLIESLEAWIPSFAREKLQLIQPLPLSFCLPAL